MAETSARKTFVNLAVEDLERSKRFFTHLGFTFDPDFTDDKGACMVISDEAYAMLLARSFFKGFTRKDVCNAATHTEVMVALSCASRAEVDEMVGKAIAAGGSHAMEPQDLGFMYGWSFYDPDGHHWEVFWMGSKPPK